jgi:predicted Zn-dependent protease with MMP-like domain
MKREDFVKVAEDALDSLPEEFRSRIHKVAILVEDFSGQPNTASTGMPRAIASRHIPRCVNDEEELL